MRGRLVPPACPLSGRFVCWPRAAYAEMAAILKLCKRLSSEHTGNCVAALYVCVCVVFFFFFFGCCLYSLMAGTCCAGPAPFPLACGSTVWRPAGAPLHLHSFRLHIFRVCLAVLVYQKLKVNFASLGDTSCPLPIPLSTLLPFAVI